jgi:RimJ/RimL family protein N-acetyltransferase
MLKGERVLLRAARREDMAKQCEFNNDLEVELTSGGDPPMPQPLERLLAEFDRQAGEGGRDRGQFIIEAGGKMIGSCGLFSFNDTFRTCELGIIIGDKDYWGKGYGREAIRLLLEYAFRYHNMRRVYLNTTATNERGLRCYRACGFVEEGRLREHAWGNGRYVDVVYLGILRSEWEAREGAETP